MKNIEIKSYLLICTILLLLIQCKDQKKDQIADQVKTLELKRGEIFLCGPADKQFGQTAFVTSCSPNSKKDFDLAIALLHSFEYDESEKMFARVADDDPNCALAYWGIAMSNFHQVWPTLPTDAEMTKGSKAIALAQSLTSQNGKEKELIDALAVFYKDWQNIAHRVRYINYEKAMEAVYQQFPKDSEVAIFYSLALIGSADPADKSYSHQKKAGVILSDLYASQPDHPGIVHYIIHTYDYPELANLALPAAKKYAAIAPASAHAQHMPSHIFTRLGMWDECIQSNLVSTASAKCYAEAAAIKGHWDEELHGMDYLEYAYLQQGDNKKAKELLNYMNNIHEVYPLNFKVAYAFAAIPARYYLENKLWADAADLKIHPQHFPWQKFPWQKANYHFARLLGAAHTSDTNLALSELSALQTIHDTLVFRKDSYPANQVLIQVKSGEAWILFAQGKNKEALQKMQEAAELEDKTEKSPVTPGELIPARELLGDMLMLMKQPEQALLAYQSDLQNHPGRFNGLYGAATAAVAMKDNAVAKSYLEQLLRSTASSGSQRPELTEARRMLENIR